MIHKVTIEEIEAARKKVLENSAELIEEAELLFRHQMFAPTVALFYSSGGTQQTPDPCFRWHAPCPPKERGPERRVFNASKL